MLPGTHKTTTMKKIIILTGVLLVAVLNIKAQCLSKVRYTASKMEIVDSAMNVNGSQDAPVTLLISEKGFEGVKGDIGEDSLHGTLKSVTCNWKEPYKNGKIVMVCDVKTPNEDLHDVNITIEAVDGKITILLNAKEHPNELIRLLVDKYEEAK